MKKVLFAKKTDIFAWKFYLSYSFLQKNFHNKHFLDIKQVIYKVESIHCKIHYNLIGTKHY